VSVADMVQYLKSILATARTMSRYLSCVFSNSARSGHVIALFLAVLEMVKTAGDRNSAE
jgi:hypothetical protein